MKQQERLDFLLEKLKEDSVQYKNLQVEENETAKKEAVRSLMNIRMPRYIDRKILKVQDEFLQNQTFGEYLFHKIWEQQQLQQQIK